MKRVVCIAIMFCVLQLANATTFVISNFSGESVAVKPVWDKDKNQEITLQKGAKSEKYNSGFNKVHSIVWKQNGKKYTAPLYDIDLTTMLNREFVIFDDGKYVHSFVRFPYKRSGVETAQVWPPL